MSLVDANGNELTTKKRRRQKNLMKKEVPQGDVLFQLIVDLPEGVSEDQYNKIMTEYFGIGHEVFRAKVN